jgi:hypothetical protein
VATYSPPIDFQCGLLVWLNAQSVIDGAARLLPAPEVLFCSLDRDMSEQELDLIQFAAGEVAQTGAGATKAMRSELLDTSANCSLPNHLPPHLRCNST